MSDRAIHRKKHPNAARISRAKLKTLREELNATHDVVTETFNKFWIIPEGDIRETLAVTQKKIGRAVTMLRKAA